MNLRYEVGDVLDAPADGLIITVDGNHPKLLGNVASQLKRRLGDKWEEIEDELDFPIASGDVRQVAVQMPPFRYIFALSVLDHAKLESRESRPELVRSALVKAMRMAAKEGLKSLACTLLTCGWRVNEKMAKALMESAADLVPSVALVVRVRPARSPGGSCR